MSKFHVVPLMKRVSVEASDDTFEGFEIVASDLNIGYAEAARNKILVQACLRAPHVVADEAKLAIVFTYFFS